MTPYYITIPVTLSQYHAQSGFYTLGTPALSGITGFAHALSLKTEPLFGFQVDGVAVGVRDMLLHPGHEKHVKYLQCRNEGPGGPGALASILDRRLASAELFLVLRIESEDQSFDFRFNDHRQHLWSILMASKIAGGTVTISEPCALSIMKTANEALKHIPYFVRFLQDARIDLLEYQEQEGCPMEQAFFDLTRRKKEQEETTTASNRPNGFFVPVAVGYHLLEDPTTERTGVRGGYPHAFAEPLIGLARYRTCGSIRRGGPENAPIFWRQTDEERFLFAGGWTAAELTQ
jgi:CRISPR type I-F-associated protein Csy2